MNAKTTGSDWSGPGGLDEQRIAALQERLAKLELWSGMMRWAVFLLLIALVGVAGGGIVYVRLEAQYAASEQFAIEAARPKPPAAPLPKTIRLDTLEVHALNLLDDAGQPRAVLMVNNDVAAFGVFSKDGKRCASLDPCGLAITDDKSVPTCIVTDDGLLVKGDDGRQSKLHGAALVFTQSNENFVGTYALHGMGVEDSTKKLTVKVQEGVTVAQKGQPDPKH